MNTLNYANTCKLYARSYYKNSGSAHVPDFWIDAYGSQVFSDTEYASERTQFLGWMTDLGNGNLQGTDAGSNIISNQTLLSEITSDSVPPSR